MQVTGRVSEKWERFYLDTLIWIQNVRAKYRNQK